MEPGTRGLFVYMAASRSGFGYRGSLFYLKNKIKILRKEKNPDPEIHRFGTTKLLEYMVWVRSELW